MGRAKPEHSGKCAALCCGSARLSNSSSKLVHDTVQSRLQKMIDESYKAGHSAVQMRRKSTSKLVVLVAVDRDSFDPRTDFRESMLEVIASKGLKEPRELRSLLNCYISLNSEDHRGVILEAFHEVCSSLFCL